MVTAQQHLGNFHTTKLLGARILRKFQRLAVAKALDRRTFFATEYALYLGVLAALLALHFALPAYHHTNIARIMVLAIYAMGYNIAFGYTGLLSLGHALLFAAGAAEGEHDGVAAHIVE